MSAVDIAAMNKIACGDAYPDVTIILDIDSQIGLARGNCAAMGKTVLKLKVIYIMRTCGQGFLKLRLMNRHVVMLIDANREPNEISADIWQVVRPHLFASGLIDNE